MNTIRAARPLPLALTMLVTLFTALVALALTGGHGAHATNTPSHHGHGPAAAGHGHISAKQVALREDMRRLWEDHIVWTRLAIISLTTDSPDTEATVGRLLANQTDIGNALKPYYGRTAGNEVTRLLEIHIHIAADVVAAAKAGDEAALADAQARWVANADDIARALSALNPRFWPEKVLRHEMHTHLDLTTQEAVARLTADWDADVAAYDAVHAHILHMSDVLSTGIVRQFPRRFN